MRPSLRLLQHTARLTLFTRANCSLCETAKTVISTVEKRREFQYVEVDVMGPGQKQWRDLYEFDTPVLHVQRIFHTYSKPDIATEARKLLHRFTEAEVEGLLDEAEGHS